MPFNLPLPSAFRNARWKVKIREKESREPPHVTILQKTKAWRINLRTGEFMDDVPDPSEVPNEIINHIKAAANWQLLCQQWNLKYPENRVRGTEQSNEE